MKFERTSKSECLIDDARVCIVDQTIADPLVSVTMITFQHEKYISEAIEGVLLQKTNFTYELIIGEDCSLDGTRAIVKDYQAKHPDKIILKLPEKNLGMMRNSVSNKLLCRGKYIAECEGDDYWTDPYKLQKQVDFLESNPAYVLCFHNVNILIDNVIVDDFITSVPANRDTFTMSDIIRGNFIHTPSAIFRNNISHAINSFIDCQIGDHPLYIVLSLSGKIKYINNTMAVYRYGTGLWSKKSIEEKFCDSINMFILILKYSFQNAFLIRKNKYNISFITYIRLFILVILKIFKLTITYYIYKIKQIYKST